MRGVRWEKKGGERGGEGEKGGRKGRGGRVDRGKEGLRGLMGVWWCGVVGGLFTFSFVRSRIICAMSV